MLHFISSSVVRCSCLPLKTAQRHMRTKIIITLILSALPLVCSAQKWSISTNLADYVMLGTMNSEGTVA